MKTPVRLPWPLYFLLFLLALVAGGAVTGAALFWLVGTLVQAKFSAWELLQNGARIGGFFLLVWAPGLAGVATFMREQQARREKA